ncbi:hypothetical protein [Snodgrassella alvi]|jgi:hypothetical protein|uniref:hypothetical protein n=1 Tax=Snodgrassella alvi TaxID=1196083 RepID=UPI0015D52626|nr:hypothetical protein [Snodgrassella alvi]
MQEISKQFYFDPLVSIIASIIKDAVLFCLSDTFYRSMHKQLYNRQQPQYG